MNVQVPLPHPRALAHLGDAVYELWVREAAIGLHQKSEDLHIYTIKRVNAEVQGKLLAKLVSSLTEEEYLILKRAQNMPVTSSRRSDQLTHRKATGFEALIGYWYLTDPQALAERKILIMKLLEEI